MNIMFWVLMIAMLLVGIGLLVYPLLRVKNTTVLAYKDSNLKINDEKIKELDLDLEEGRIDQTFYKAAREELDRELLIDVPAESKETASIHYGGVMKRHPALALMITIFVPMLGLLLYLELGMHAAGEDGFVASQQLKAMQSSEQPSVEDMTLQLEAKIESNGGTAKEWTMLGRAHKYLNKYEQSARAFAVALEQDKNNAQLMLERAEVLAVLNNRLFNDESRALVLRAYELEPDNPNSMWFIGVAEFQNKNYRQAIDHLKRLLPLARDEKEVVNSIISVISSSRQALVAAGEEIPELEQLLSVETITAEPSQSTAPSDTQAAAAAMPATQLQISIDISEDVRQKFNANDTVFVYAKAKQGPRMPLAAQRLTLAELPATVILDDNMAMVEGMNLSAFDQLLVSARVSKSGSAIAQSGDYIGQIGVEDKKANTMLSIVINTLVP